MLSWCIFRIPYFDKLAAEPGLDMCPLAKAVRRKVIRLWKKRYTAAQNVIFAPKCTSKWGISSSDIRILKRLFSKEKIF